MVSIVIPAYNSEKYIEKSVLSAVSINAVGEVIVVDDGSSDNTFKICENLSLRHPKIKLIQHPGGKNLGESSSRNLGIANSMYPYIAFLDSDDFYLENRFDKDIELLESDSAISGIYSKTAIKDEKSDILVEFGGEFNVRLINPKNENNLKILFEEKLNLFDVNGITLRRSFILDNGLFDDRLQIHPDTELWWRLLRNGIFLPGETEIPVAIAIRHGGNIILKKSISSQIKLLAVYIDNIGFHNIQDFEKKYFIFFIGRIFSNPIRIKLLRKFVLYFIRIFGMPFRTYILYLLYYWSLKMFNLLDK